MKVIHSNPKETVGIVTELVGLTTVGEFDLAILEEWIKQVRDVFGDDEYIHVQFKMSDDAREPGYMITACHGNTDPKIAVCGTYKKDGTKWESG